MTVIYLAKQALNGLFATAAYMARSITNYTVAQPSDLNIFGKPSNQQLAFDGYRSNIEAFICATSFNRKLNCDLSHYYIDASREVTVPLALPKTVFSLKNKPTPEQEKKMLDAGKGMGLSRADVGKGFVYTIDTPTIEFLGKVRRAAHDSCVSLTDYSQIGATFQFFWITQCIDLFLATNTYSYRPDQVNTDRVADADNNHPVVGVEYYGNTEWANDCSDENQRKKRKLDAGWESRNIVDTLNERGYDTYLGPANSVFVAKPSPLPSSTSWGTPMSCPNSKGIHFPYFEGLHHSDVSFTRRMVNTHFFRNLGSSAKGPKEAFQEFRTTIGPACSTPSGRILNHVLYGVHLALQTQTQLYLLFDEGHYYGFNLLGGYFSIWDGQWKEPCSEADLQSIMGRYKSHEASLKELNQLMKSLKIVPKPDCKLPTGNIKYSCDLGKFLSLVDLEKTEGDVLDVIESLVKLLVFRGTYRVMNADNIQGAVRELLEFDDVERTQLIFIPSSRTQWKHISSPYFPALASFGARSFSLRDRGAKATEVPLTTEYFKKKLEKGDKQEKVKTNLPFFEKPLGDCIADWGQVVQSGKGRYNFAERAIGSRGFLVRDDEMIEIIKLFEEAKSDKTIGVGVPKSDKKGKSKQTEDIEMGGVVTLDELFP